MKIIFIEGVSGVGKSTTAVKLRDALLDRCYNAVCYLEGDTDNPADFYNCAYLSKTEFSRLLQDYPNDADAFASNSIQEADYVLVRYGDKNVLYFTPPLLTILKAHEGFYKPAEPIGIDRYMQVFSDCWKRYLCRDNSSIDFTIFDGSFLYHRANDLIYTYNAADETIAAHLENMISVMTPLVPFLFYLSSDNVGERLTQARKSRGQVMATKAQAAFEEERKRRQKKILKLLSIRTQTFDVSDGWENAVGEMFKIITGSCNPK